jgi:hypothetical protein
MATLPRCQCRLRLWNIDLEGAMLKTFLPLWAQDKSEILGRVLTLLMFTALYLGFVL